jgi:hypothetical protein
MQIDPNAVIQDLLEQNKQQALQIAMLRVALNQAQAPVEDEPTDA